MSNKSCPFLYNYSLKNRQDFFNIEYPFTKDIRGEIQNIILNFTYIMYIIVVVYHVTFVAIGHGLGKNWPVIIGCVLRPLWCYVISCVGLSVYLFVFLPYLPNASFYHLLKAFLWKKIKIRGIGKMCYEIIFSNIFPSLKIHFYKPQNVCDMNNICNILAYIGVIFIIDLKRISLYQEIQIYIPYLLTKISIIRMNYIKNI